MRCSYSASKFDKYKIKLIWLCGYFYSKQSNLILDFKARVFKENPTQCICLNTKSTWKQSWTIQQAVLWPTILKVPTLVPQQTNVIYKNSQPSCRVIHIIVCRTIDLIFFLSFSWTFIFSLNKQKHPETQKLQWVTRVCCTHLQNCLQTANVRWCIDQVQHWNSSTHVFCC